MRDTTERKRAEEELRQSDERLAESNQLLAAVLDHTHMMAVFLDPHFNFIWVNRAYADTCGHAPSFFPGKNHFELYPHEENQAIFKRVVDTGEPFFVAAKPFEFPDQPERGVTYWDWSLIPLTGAGGKVSGLVFTLAEVTERIRSVEALRESEEKHRILLEESPDSIFSFTPDGHYTYVNPAFAEGVGKPVDDIIGKRIWDVFPKEEADKRFAFLSQVFHTGQEKVIEVRVPRADGDRYYLTTITPIKNAAGQAVSAICSAKNITERKLVEEALQESEKKLKLITETIDEVFWMADVETGKIFYISQAYERIWGRSCESLYENPRSFIDAVHIEDREQVRAEFEIEKTGLPYAQEYRIILPDGNTRHIWDRGFPIRDEKGQISRYAGTAMDITERKRAVEALRESEERLREVLENSMDASYKRNLQTNTYDYLSPVFTKISGYTPDEMKSLPTETVLGLMHSDDRVEIQRVIAESMSGATGTAYQVEYRFKRKDGQHRWLLDQFTILRDERGQNLALIGSVSDITEQKKMQEQFNTTAKHLSYKVWPV